MSEIFFFLRKKSAAKTHDSQCCRFKKCLGLFKLHFNYWFEVFINRSWRWVWILRFHSKNSNIRRIYTKTNTGLKMGGNFCIIHSRVTPTNIHKISIRDTLFFPSVLELFCLSQLLSVSGGKKRKPIQLRKFFQFIWLWGSNYNAPQFKVKVTPCCTLI